MDKEKEPKVNKARKPRKYSKTAFLEAEPSLNKRFLLNIVLVDGRSYSKVDVEKALDGWRKKEVK